MWLPTSTVLGAAEWSPAPLLFPEIEVFTTVPAAGCPMSMPLPTLYLTRQSAITVGKPDEWMPWPPEWPTVLFRILQLVALRSQ